MRWVIELVKGVRSIRAEMNVPPCGTIALLLKDADARSPERLARNLEVIQQLARLVLAETTDAISERLRRSSSSARPPSDCRLAT